MSDGHSRLRIRNLESKVHNCRLSLASSPYLTVRHGHRVFLQVAGRSDDQEYCQRDTLFAQVYMTGCELLT